MSIEKKEKYKVFNALIYPILLVTIMIIVHFAQFVFDWDIHKYGIYPRRLSGLRGVLFTPFIHGDAHHLFNNSLSFIILCSTLFYFYKKISLKVLVWIYLMSGIWTWVSARESYHIGASGVIYGLFSFLLVSGFLRKSLQLVAISFFVVFVYGSMVWGIFPIKVDISYEGHLWGFIAGIVLAIYYKKQGPQRIEPNWEEEEEDEGFPYWEIENESEAKNQKINYLYRLKKKD